MICASGRETGELELKLWVRRTHHLDFRSPGSDLWHLTSGRVVRGNAEEVIPGQKGNKSPSVVVSR